MGELLNYFKRNIGQEIIDKGLLCVFTGKFSKLLQEKPFSADGIWEECSFRIPQLHSKFLQYKSGKITICKRETNEEIISGPFSGCKFAHFTDVVGNKYAAHIYMGQNGSNSCNHIWNSTYVNYVNECAIIDPFTYFESHCEYHIKGTDICPLTYCLWADDNNLYFVIINKKVEENRYFVKDIQKLAPSKNPII